MLRTRSLAPLLGLLVALLAARAGAEERAPGRPPQPRPQPGLVLGTFEVRPEDALDGDTVRVAELGTVRLLAVDTEEVPRRGEKAPWAADETFDAYARRMRGDARFPVKYPTPAGEAAKTFARDLLRGARGIRLERDAPDDPERDPFDRILAHVFVQRPEGEVLWAEEMVRHGHSPYFVKYGRSRRLDERLARAEAQARDAGRGIWGSQGPAHYPDYEERLAWWRARADQIDRWRALPPAPDRLTLGAPDAGRLRDLVGQMVTVFGSLERRRDDGRPWILYLRDQPRRPFPVVTFDLDVWRALDHRAIDRGYVSVRGKVSLYRSKPQIVIESPEQLSTD